MAVANPTDAKTIALYFLDMTTDKYTKSIIARTINQAKNLLSAGYTKEEIIETIDYILDKGDIKMYSIGYINTCINDVLRKINVEKEKERVAKLIEQSKEDYLNEDKEEEVISTDESTERNKLKAERTGIQSRKREKSYLDMLKE